MKKEQGKKVNWGDMGIILTLIAMIIFFSVVTKSFLSAKNFANIARQISITGICSVGMTMVILTGGIDLSIGSVIGFTSAVAALMMSNGQPIILASVVSLALGVIIGVINATCINYLQIPAMIATLGTQISLRGAVYLVTGGMPVYGLPESFKVLGQGSIGIIPISMIIMVIVFIIGYIILNKMVFGRKIYGIGGNAETARLSGVNVKKEIYKIYMLVGFFGSLAGLILMSRVNSGQPSAGDGYEMDIITAVVLGGVSVSGGEGKITKVIIGVIFMGVLANGMMMMNINEYWQRVVKGLVLLAAVAVDIRTKNKAS
ncbi:ABC transporter permease [Lachnospiraceae bacterium OF09-6]|nr:ABC transporter permease [Lachnospiraceae bacterium OF09-6]